MVYREYLTELPNLEDFVSYYEQLRLAKMIGQRIKKILYSGVGDGTVPFLLRKFWSTITLDTVLYLKPNVRADVRTLPFRSKAFDLVMACEVLEHIPLNDLETALKEIRRVGTFAIFSFPYAHFYLHAAFKLKLLMMGPSNIKSLTIGLESRNSKVSFPHYYEIGKKGFGKKKLEKVLTRHFRILHSFTPPLNPHQLFYLVRAREMNQVEEL